MIDKGKFELFIYWAGRNFISLYQLKGRVKFLFNSRRLMSLPRPMNWNQKEQILHSWYSPLTYVGFFHANEHGLLLNVLLINRWTSIAALLTCLDTLIKRMLWSQALKFSHDNQYFESSNCKLFCILLIIKLDFLRWNYNNTEWWIDNSSWKINQDVFSEFTGTCIDMTRYLFMYSICMYKSIDSLSVIYVG
jgi:hypothetical protein